MRSMSPFLVGVLIVSATTLGVAHVLGNDGQITNFVAHSLNGLADWLWSSAQYLVDRL